MNRSRSRRKLLLGGCALFSLLINSSHNLRAQSSAPVPNPVSPITGAGPSWTPGWDTSWKSKMDAAKRELIFATDYGVKADALLNPNGVGVESGTDDTQALDAAINYCASVGGKLLLPPGFMLIAGGGASNITTNIHNCMIEGTGFGPDTFASIRDRTEIHGTTLLLTSTSVRPFVIGAAWGWINTMFYWPNQPVVKNSIIAYPPLMSSLNPPPNNPSTPPSQHWFMDHVILANTYDGIVTSGGAFHFTNSFVYALHEAFRIGDIGDHLRITGNHFTPGPWYVLTNFAPADVNTGAMGTIIDSNNVMVHAVGTHSANMSFDNAAFAWGTALLLDSQVTVGISDFKANFDGAGTVIDASSGGSFAGHSGSPVTGVAGCGRAYTYHPELNNKPCFNMGNHSALTINGWVGSSQGSFVVNSGSIIELNNVFIGSIGSAQDGSEYHFVHTTANTGGSIIQVRNTEVQGQPGNIHNHGVTSDVPLARYIVQNSTFGYLNESINAPSAGGTTVITGNWSYSTIGDSDVNSDLLASGNTGVVYNSNSWSKPPSGTISSGGCGAGATIKGAMGGTIFVGTDGPVDCYIKLPWHPYGSGAGACQVTSNGGGIALNMNQTGQDREWHITGHNLSGTPALPGQMFFACYGQN